MLKKLYRKITRYSLEENKLLEFLDEYTNEKNILDVGCGYGRILRLLKSNNYNVLGVEINPKIVKSCLSDGLECVNVNEFYNGVIAKKEWDAIIMFHIIEHLSPEQCYEFIDEYLDKLKLNGVLIIATPLMTPYFYEDFDHIKPYLPVGIQMVFGLDNAQVQFRSRNKLELIDLWYKRYFYRVVNQRFYYFPTFKIIIPIMNFTFALLFKISLGMIGRKDGWIGVFRKIK